MNKSTKRVAAHQANEPQNQEDHKYRPKHSYTSRGLSLASIRLLGFLRTKGWLFAILKVMHESAQFLSQRFQKGAHTT
jgi:hypothetical protein